MSWVVGMGLFLLLALVVYFMYVLATGMDDTGDDNA